MSVSEGNSTVQKNNPDLSKGDSGIIDQDIPEFVIAKNGEPIGTIEDGDSLIFQFQR